MMRDWMRANLRWSEETARYGDHIPRSWKTGWFATDWALPRPVDQSKELCVRARGT